MTTARVPTREMVLFASDQHNITESDLVVHEAFAILFTIAAALRTDILKDRCRFGVYRNRLLRAHCSHGWRRTDHRRIKGKLRAWYCCYCLGLRT